MQGIQRRGPRESSKPLVCIIIGFGARGWGAVGAWVLWGLGVGAWGLGAGWGLGGWGVGDWAGIWRVFGGAKVNYNANERLFSEPLSVHFLPVPRLLTTPFLSM